MSKFHFVYSGGAALDRASSSCGPRSTGSGGCCGYVVDGLLLVKLETFICISSIFNKFRIGLGCKVAQIWNPMSAVNRSIHARRVTSYLVYSTENSYTYPGELRLGLTIFASVSNSCFRGTDAYCVCVAKPPGDQGASPGLGCL